MLGTVLGAAVILIGKFVYARVVRVEPARRPPPDPSRFVATARGYEAWADRVGLAYDERARGWRGSFASRPVLVRPGLDGSAPVGVEAEITIEHGETEHVLVSRRQEPGDVSSTAVRALTPLFDEVAALRSIAILSGGVRLGFDPLTAAHITERAVERAIEALRELRMKQPLPYR